MSTRFNYDGGGDEEAILRFGRWVCHRKNALTGKPGIESLKELETSLLGLNPPRLISGSLCDGTGVCAMGAWTYRHWVDVDGMTPKAAWKRLRSERKRAASQWDQGDSWEWPDENELDRTIDIGVSELGITRTLAEAIAAMNDEEWFNISPEERYRRILQWVRDRIAKVPERGLTYY